jgi:methylated-DNA-protein-cysteine methyltransferase related protein
MTRSKSPGVLWQPLRATRKGSAAPLDNPDIHALWHVVAAIPRGHVTTYGAVARAAGLPGRARQAGYALKIAPKSLLLPWHRVVGAGGRIAFPAGSLHHRDQVRRLRAEGVKVISGRVAREALSPMQI